VVKRFALPAMLAALVALGTTLTGQTPSRRFDQTLPQDRQAIHVLNRLTFGPRAADIEAINRIGVERWIEAQLRPERITESSILEARLTPLETLRIDSSEIIRDYMAPPAALRIAPPTPLNQLLTPDQARRVLNGTAEDRKAVLSGLDAATRQKVLVAMPPPLLAVTPELSKEADAARAAQMAERQQAMRQMMPPLNELLTPDQMQTAMRGNSEQIAALFNYLEPAKRQQVAAALPPQALVEFPDMRRAGMKLRQPQQIIGSDLREGKVFRAIYSERQLEEVLVDFWFNHFNVFEGKPQARPVLASYERDAIRPHVLGRFKDLLLATARHPAMLHYLDNWESMSPEAFEIGPFAGPPGNVAQQLQRMARGLNENYGRELLELHTLGVDGGYTQQDVVNVARAFTGWTIRAPNVKPEFVFASFMHDTREKTILGKTFPAGGGESDGLQVIELLARHPSTAKFISRKLAQRFVADDPPQPLVDRMAQTFARTDGDIRAVLGTMFSSTEFLSEGAWLSKIKSPLELVTSAIRALQGDTIDTLVLTQRVGDLGQPLYGKLEPTGYPNTSESWLSTGTLLGRMNFATALVSGQIPGVKIKPFQPGDELSASARALLGREASSQTLDALRSGLQGREATPAFVAGMVIGSPDFQRK
jgi:uncharacterized protein (DUF1800 family)